MAADPNNVKSDFVTEILACTDFKYNEVGEYSIYVTIPIEDLNNHSIMNDALGIHLSAIVPPVDYEENNVCEPQLIIRRDNDGYVLYIEVYISDDNVDVVFEKYLEEEDFPVFVEKIGNIYSWYDDFSNKW